MKTLLIRAEDKNRWESRTPIVPQDLKTIIGKTGAEVFVEKSGKRYVNESEYTDAGARICDGMSPGEVILGIKEIPVEKILDNKTYLFFSHTIKGQKSNMGLLQKIIDSGSTLIDYEKIIDQHNRRLLYFGPYAGSAGAIDILSLLGEKWAAKGIETPFRKIKRAHEYGSLMEALDQIRAIGHQIQSQGLPEELAPFTIGLLGYGNVSQGAQQVFNCLPAKQVPPHLINELLSKGEGDSHTIYICVFKEEDLVQPIDRAAEFSLQEYYEYPERYESCFDQYLGSFTLLVNAVYWTSRYPRFITWDSLKKLLERDTNLKLAGIADISCDIEGAVECTLKATDSDAPAYRIDPVNKRIHDGHLGDGIVLLAVDNLPCELPHDSSTFFSKQLTPFVSNLLEADYASTLESSHLAPELKAATIVYNGKLTKDYKYLQSHLQQRRGE